MVIFLELSRGLGKRRVFVLAYSANILEKAPSVLIKMGQKPPQVAVNDHQIRK